MQHESYLKGLDEYSKGDFARAEALLEETLRSAQEDKDRNAIALTLNRLGDVYVNEERFREAEQSYLQALSIFKNNQANNVAVAAVQRNLATVYSLQGRDHEAIILLNQASQQISAEAGGQTELAAEILNSLGMVYFRQKNLRKAEALIAQALEISLKRGIADPKVGQGFNNLAMIHQKRRKYIAAEQAYKRSLDITEKLLGPLHPDMALTRENLGVLYTEMRRFKDAREELLQSLAITEQIVPIVEGRVVRTLQRLSAAYREDGDVVEAERTLLRAVQLVRHKTHPDLETSDVLEAYSSILKTAGKLQEARDIHAEAQRTRAELALTVRVQGLK